MVLGLGGQSVQLRLASGRSSITRTKGLISLLYSSLLQLRAEILNSCPDLTPSLQRILHPQREIFWRRLGGTRRSSHHTQDLPALCYKPLTCQIGGRVSPE